MASDIETLRVVLLGDVGAGKTALFRRLADGSFAEVSKMEGPILSYYFSCFYLYAFEGEGTQACPSLFRCYLLLIFI
jgi:GTPase SAR1 family protein